ncbi:MAG TPA: DUF2339 domain-containing protein, partial [Acidobacteriota bacterium]|nr:DUF2339 domain-containing protein [Acidobacteriota bacterium]
MRHLVFAVVGLIVGAILLRGLGGAAAGLLLGLAVFRLWELSSQVETLTQLVGRLEGRLTRLEGRRQDRPAAQGETQESGAGSASQAAAPASAAPSAQPQPAPGQVRPSQGAEEPPRRPAQDQPAVPHPAASGRQKAGRLAEELRSGRPQDAKPPLFQWESSGKSSASSLDSFFDSLRQMLLGGNTVARVGILILLVGVSLLAKYAIDNNLVSVQARLVLAALIGAALLGLGWRLRGRRRGFALTLQGGGVGALYITVFFAFRIYSLIPGELAFVLLAGLSGLLVWLAVPQNSLALAALAMVGGFLAPIAASSQQGNHVVLFSYYALLNAVIFLICWLRPWRMLTLLGFTFTFGVGSIWGALRYQPDDFATTEPFLVLFFLFYVVQSVVHAWRNRQPSGALNWISDEGIVFATPAMTLILQAAMVYDTRYGLAWTSLALGLFYALSSVWLRRRGPAHLKHLVEVFLALSVAFSILFIPFAFEDPYVITSLWALQGAGLMWVGVRRHRVLAQVTGIALQVAAVLAFADSFSGRAPETAIANGRFAGFAILTLSAGFIAFCLRPSRKGSGLFGRLTSYLMLAWGSLCWMAGLWAEIWDFVEFDYRHHVNLVAWALTALTLEGLGKRLSWSAGRRLALFLLPGALFHLLALPLFIPHPSAYAGWAAWPLVGAVLLIALRRQEDSLSSRLAATLHAGLVVLFTPLLVWEASWQTGHWTALHGESWVFAARLLSSSCVLAFLAWAADRPSWPWTPFGRAYLKSSLVPAILVFAFIVLGAANSGDAAPLPFLPLANPADLSSAAGLLALWLWFRKLTSTRIFDRKAYTSLLWPWSLLAFFWLNA